MFDFIKELLGISGCRGCVHRRLGGLYCGYKMTSEAMRYFKPSAWDKYGCWQYVDKPKTLYLRPEAERDEKNKNKPQKEIK